eukprot:CAMPEP_0115751792 /NCGR_PEP_ID=MMETSP0272-20121206/95451_1 /TAXON_ID=71861 /ORGANISM="Scrippsiella trochoidea, Strain CCMP3099" /LENGTH=103 /DNA_ID=CAMNT_0003197007 /DNA_START=6 /DNA_END=317 /DNA_ORIENTATION=-
MSDAHDAQQAQLCCPPWRHTRKLPRLGHTIHDAQPATGGPQQTHVTEAKPPNSANRVGEVLLIELGDPPRHVNAEGLQQILVLKAQKPQTVKRVGETLGLELT